MILPQPVVQFLVLLYETVAGRLIRVISTIHLQSRLLLLLSLLGASLWLLANEWTDLRVADLEDGSSLFLTLPLNNLGVCDQNFLMLDDFLRVLSALLLSAPSAKVLRHN